jgi:TonB family protein
MKIIHLLFLIFVSASVVVAQVKPKIDPEKDPQNISIVTDQEPFYPKGEQELYMHVLRSVKYSDEAKANQVKGEVMMSFDVLPDSSITNIVVISGPGYGIEDGVKEVIKGLKFAPAVQNGVRVRMNVMMDFPVRAH